MKYKILALLLLACNYAYAQKYLNNLSITGRHYWGADSNFCLSNYKTGVPSYQYFDSSDVLMGTVSALIADSIGELIFYTNGFRIGNKNYEMIPGTDTLDYTSSLNNWPYGQPTLNGAFFLPSLTNPNEILLFHKDWQFTYFLNGLIWTSYNAWYTVLDKTMNNGLGGLVSRNNVLYNSEFCRGGLQAVKHANGRDYWIVLQDFDTTTFITFLYTPYGFYGPYFQNMNIPIYRIAPHNSIFNRQGTKYATCSWNNNLMLFDFNRCTGQFTYHNQVDTGISYGGFIFCFSASGNKIYRNNYIEIYQYDTADVDFNISRDTVGIYDGFMAAVDTYFVATIFGPMFLAADNKIYINATNTQYQHVINKPDLPGNACNIVQHAIKHPSYTGLAMPTYINYNLGPLIGSPCDTLSVLYPQPNLENLIQCFPNPAINDITIKLNNIKQGAYTLHIYSPLGHEVFSTYGKNANATFTRTIDVSAWPQGVYFVWLECGGEVFSGRFVKE